MSANVPESDKVADMPEESVDDSEYAEDLLSHILAMWKETDS